MTQEALKLALEALEDALNKPMWDRPKMTKAITAIKEAQKEHDMREVQRLGQEIEQEPVAHPVIAGALFDFMGWLTSRKERIVLSSADNASPAADAIRDFANMRGLSLNDAKVQDWNTTPPQLEERNFCPRCGKRTKDIHTCTPPQRTWVGLTFAEICECESEYANVFARNIEAKLKEKNNA